MYAGKTQNANESFNSLIWEHVPKVLRIMKAETLCI